MTRRQGAVAPATSDGEWIAHDGAGLPPIDLETIVDVRHFDGMISHETAAEFWCGGLDPWIHAKCGHDEIKIIAYRVVGAA